MKSVMEPLCSKQGQKANSLPTKRNMCVKKILFDGLYPIRSREEEIVIYLLWNCLASNDIWAHTISHK